MNDSSADALRRRTLVRLHHSHLGTTPVVVPMCDRCAAMIDLDRNQAPMLPLFACSVCGDRNIVSRVPVGWSPVCL